MDLFPEFSTMFSIISFQINGHLYHVIKLIKLTPCYFMALRDHMMDI